MKSEQRTIDPIATGRLRELHAASQGYVSDVGGMGWCIANKYTPYVMLSHDEARWLIDYAMKARVAEWIANGEKP